MSTMTQKHKSNVWGWLNWLIGWSALAAMAGLVVSVIAMSLAGLTSIFMSNGGWIGKLHAFESQSINKKIDAQFGAQLRAAGFVRATSYDSFSVGKMIDITYAHNDQKRTLEVAGPSGINASRAEGWLSLDDDNMLRWQDATGTLEDNFTQQASVLRGSMLVAEAVLFAIERNERHHACLESLKKMQCP